MYYYNGYQGMPNYQQYVDPYQVTQVDQFGYRPQTAGTHHQHPHHHELQHPQHHALQHTHHHTHHHVHHHHHHHHTGTTGHAG